MRFRMSREVRKEITSKHELIQTFYIEKMQCNLILSVPYAEVLYFPSNQVLIYQYGRLRSQVELQEGLTYSVISHVPDFDTNKLKQAEALPLPDFIKASENYFQVPPLSDRVINLAKDLTKDAKS